TAAAARRTAVMIPMEPRRPEATKDLFSSCLRVFVVLTHLPVELDPEPREPRRDDRRRQQERGSRAPRDVRTRVRVRQIVSVDEHADAPRCRQLEHFFDAYVEQDDVVLTPAA